jgi:hypothetical protein
MWTSLGNPGEPLAGLSLGPNADGHLEAFALTSAREVWHTWQVSPGGDWGGWTIFGSQADGATFITVAQNADTRLELFRIDSAGAVWYSSQLAPNADWSTWTPMDNPEAADSLVVVRNADGRLEIFVAPTSASGNSWHAWQMTPNSGWSGWSQLGDPLGSPIGRLCGAQNADGHLELFAMTPASGVWHIFQLTPGGDWSNWTLLSAATAASTDMALGQNIDGRLEIFLISDTNEISHASQIVPNGGWSDWSPLPNADQTGTHLAVARNADGRLEVFLVAVAATGRRNPQAIANDDWAGWQTLDTQSIAGPLSVAQNLDGRLEVFAITPDGDLVHAWQQSANQWTWPGPDLASAPQINPGQGPGLFLTQHADSARTGWTAFETALDINNVGNLQVLFNHGLDGTTYAQPLYVAAVSLADGTTHNVVYVATENNTVYAFDADSAQAELWSRGLVPDGEAPVSSDDIEGCSNIAPVIGVTSTPVIADSTGTLYVVTKTRRLADGTFHQYLNALDITTGADQPNSPVEVWASCPGVSQVNDGQATVGFVTQWQLNRPGLLLLDGVVYLAFGAHCDLHPGIYHGWVIGYDAVTLIQLAVWCASPNTVQPDQSSVQSGGGGIWQSGVGLAADSSSAVYCATGNGPFDADSGGRNYGDSVVKLSRDLRVLDSFTPSDQATLLANDLDLGSGGPLVVPDQGGGTGVPADLLLMCGKDGDLVLLNRQSLGGYTGPDSNDSQAVQVVPLQPGRASDTEPGVFGGGAYYHVSGPAGDIQFVYYCGGGGPLTAFTLDNGTLSLASQTAEAFDSGTPCVSSNGTAPATGIVWMLARQNPLRLLAFDATDLTRQLLDIGAGPWNNAGGGPFLEPTTVNGKVYVASDGQLSVLGL